MMESQKNKLRLNDHLADIRTILANERTFLAYQRTGLTQFAAGATFIHFFEGTILKILGWFFIVTAILTIFLGIWRYQKTKKEILKIEEKQD